MHCENSAFPGLARDGGMAEYLLTSARACVKLDPETQPEDVAALADAGITAYHAVRKAIPLLYPGTTAVVIGAGGLGHIGIQCLAALTATNIIVVDRNPDALKLADQLGANQTVVADGKQVDAVKDLTDGQGAHVVLDFVAEQGAENDGWDMTRPAGSYYVIGYGGQLTIPTLDIISTERNIIGNIVGTYNDLAELMVLAQAGKVTLHTRTYPLDAAPEALPTSTPAGSAAAPSSSLKESMSWPRNCDSARTPAACCWPASTSWPRRSSRRSAPRAATSSWRRSPASPVVTNDGVTIAREIHLNNQFENMGAQLVKEAAIKTNDIVGDGTTTATVIAQAIIREGMEAIGNGGNPVLVKRGVDLAVGQLVEHLHEVAHPVETEDDYARVAAISANDDDAVGAVIAKALFTVGDGGIVTVEESPTPGMSVDFVEGFEYDNGYLSPYLVTHPASLEAILDDPYILLCSEKITKVQELMPLLDKVMRAPRPLVIIAENVEGTALSHAGAQPRQRHLPVRRDAGARVRRPAAAQAGGHRHDHRRRRLQQALRLHPRDDDRGPARPGLPGAGHRRQHRDHRRLRHRGSGRVPGHPAARRTGAGQFGIDEDVLTERIGALSGKVAVIRVGAPTNAELHGTAAPGRGRAVGHPGRDGRGHRGRRRRPRCCTPRACWTTLDVTGDYAIGVDIVRRALTEPAYLIATNAGYPRPRSWPRAGRWAPTRASTRSRAATAT